MAAHARPYLRRRGDDGCRGSVREPSPPVPRAAPALFSPGPSRTSAASPTTSGLPNRSRRLGRRTCRAASRRARPATARCSRAGRSPRRGSTSGSRPRRSGLRTASSRRGTRRRRRPLSCGASAPIRPPGGYQPADLILFGVEDGAERSRRALARQRPDRPVLLERQRLEHPAARRVRRSDRLGAMEADDRWMRQRDR